MILPKKLKVLGLEIEIKEFENLTRSDGSMGRNDTKTNTIYICKDMSLRQKRQTLWHEILHFIADLNGYDLGETCISALSIGVNAVIQDNKYEEDEIEMLLGLEDD